MDMPVHLLSYPQPGWHIRGGANFRSLTRAPTSPRKAMHEWIALADAIEALGAPVAVLPPPEGELLTGMMYAANFGRYFPHSGRFLVSKMSVSHRQGEAAHVAAFFRETLGLEAPQASEIWEGQADVADLGADRHILTWGVRTAHAACDLVRDELGPSARTLDVKLREPFFHGDTCLSVLRRGDGSPLLMVYPGALVDHTETDLARFGAIDLLPIDERDALAYACNALQVGKTLLVPTGVSDALLARLEAEGITPRPMDFGELFGKGGGGPRCLVNVLRGLPSERIPDPVRFATLRPHLLELAEGYPESL